MCHYQKGSSLQILMIYPNYDMMSHNIYITTVSACNGGILTVHA